MLVEWGKIGTQDRKRKHAVRVEGQRKLSRIDGVIRTMDSRVGTEKRGLVFILHNLVSWKLNAKMYNYYHCRFYSSYRRRALLRSDKSCSTPPEVKKEEVVLEIN